MKIACLSIIMLVVLQGSVHSRQKSAAVKVRGKVTKKSIQLRWAPDSPIAWELANKYRYTVERTKLTENGRVVKDAVAEVISEVIMKPAPESQWSLYLEKDDHAAVAAQAIFGLFKYL